MTKLPTRLDRYPAKMVSGLADRLVSSYASNGKRILDPFCGSGAVLVAGQSRGIEVTGVDLNPIASLHSEVKLSGFVPDEARRLASILIRSAAATRKTSPIRLPLKDYWFTPKSLDKFERLRSAALRLDLPSSRNGMAVLLALSLSVRLCSRADQRSPKPFVSKRAIQARRGRHFDPYSTLLKLVDELSSVYGSDRNQASHAFLLADLCSDKDLPRRLGKFSHVITSPPYINAQDYFRNFKLELYVLEGLLPFCVEDVCYRFVGRERGNLLGGISASTIQRQIMSMPELKELTQRDTHLAAVVHRYLFDMGRAFDNIKLCMERNGVFVLVCGDNLIGGIKVRTWKLLRRMLEERGFALFDSFSDKIENRLLAPKRCGHKGLIKEEVVSAFKAM